MSTLSHDLNLRATLMCLLATQRMHFCEVESERVLRGNLRIVRSGSYGRVFRTKKGLPPLLVSDVLEDDQFSVLRALSSPARWAEVGRDFAMVPGVEGLLRAIGEREVCIKLLFSQLSPELLPVMKDDEGVLLRGCCDEDVAMREALYSCLMTCLSVDANMTPCVCPLLRCQVTHLLKEDRLAVSLMYPLLDKTLEKWRPSGPADIQWALWSILSQRDAAFSQGNITHADGHPGNETVFDTHEPLAQLFVDSRSAPAAFFHRATTHFMTIDWSLADRDRRVNAEALGAGQAFLQSKGHPRTAPAPAATGAPSLRGPPPGAWKSDAACAPYSALLLQPLTGCMRDHKPSQRGGRVGAHADRRGHALLRFQGHTTKRRPMQDVDREMPEGRPGVFRTVHALMGTLQDVECERADAEGRKPGLFSEAVDLLWFLYLVRLMLGQHADRQFWPLAHACARVMDDNPEFRAACAQLADAVERKISVLFLSAASLAGPRPCRARNAFSDLKRSPFFLSLRLGAQPLHMDAGEALYTWHHRG